MQSLQDWRWGKPRNLSRRLRGHDPVKAPGHSQGVCVAEIKCPVALSFGNADHLPTDQIGGGFNEVRFSLWRRKYQMQLALPPIDGGGNSATNGCAAVGKIVNDRLRIMDQRAGQRGIPRGDLGNNLVLESA